MNSTNPDGSFQWYKLTGAHLNLTAQSTLKMRLAKQVMSHIVSASLSAVAIPCKDTCTECYKLHSVMKKVANENNECYFSKFSSPERSCDRTDDIVVIIEYL
jgi:hypothetical protein